MNVGRVVARCLFLILAIALLNAAAASSRHNPRYAAYDYDLTTPQYTPDGRLLQVEYATNACVRQDSNPIVSVGINLPAGRDNILIMATVSSSPSAKKGRGSTDEQADRRDENEVNSLVKDTHQRTQFRIIEVPLSTSYHRSSTILVGLSGLLSDAASLLQVVYSHLEEEQHTLGWHRLGLSPVGLHAADSDSGSATQIAQPSPSGQSQSIATQPSETVLRLSRAIADECQKNAFGGGLRPLGASMLLAGMDAPQETIEGSKYSRFPHSARVAMCETHPNGGWKSRVSAGKGNMSKPAYSHQIMVSGGPAKSQHTLKTVIDSRLRQLYERSCGMADQPQNGNSNIEALKEGDETVILRQVLQSTISSLVEEWRYRGGPLLSSPTALLASAKGSAARTNPPSEMKFYEHPELPQMEVVISSPKLGTFRLTQADVACLMRSTDTLC